MCGITNWNTHKRAFDFVPEIAYNRVRVGLSLGCLWLSLLDLQEVQERIRTTGYVCHWLRQC